MTKLQPISDCGRVCFFSMNLLIIACASVGISTVWWSVWFWDCAGTGSEGTYHSLLLQDGLCFTHDRGNTVGPFEECTKWTAIQDSDAVSPPGRDAAEHYIGAWDLLVMILFGTFIFLLLSTASFFYKNVLLIRWAQLWILGFVVLFFISAIGVATVSYWTDFENYGTLYDNCASKSQFPNAGWIATLLGLFMTLSLMFSIALPCLQCVDTRDPPRPPPQRPPSVASL